MWSNLGPQGVLVLCWPSYPTLSNRVSYIQLGEQQKPQPSLFSASKATTQYHLSLKVAKRTLVTRRPGRPRGGIRCHLHHPKDKDCLERGHHRLSVNPSLFHGNQSLLLPFCLFLSFSLFLKRLEIRGKPLPHPLLCPNLCLWGRKMAK